MGICSGRNHNYSIRFSLQEFQPNEYYYRDNDDYPAGTMMNRFVRISLKDSIDVIKKKKICKWVWSDRPGNYINNSFFDGAIGLVTNQKADILFRPNEYTIDKQFVDYTNTAASTFLHTMQTIQNKSNRKDTNLISLMNFLLPSFSFLVLVLAAFVLYLLSLFLISNLKKFKSLNFLNEKSFCIKIFFVTLTIFSFFICNFFNSNLNTTNVIVATNELLSSLEKIIESDREICFFDESADQYYFALSPKNSKLSKIFEKRNQRNLCTMLKDNNFGNAITKDDSKTFLVIYDFMIDTTSKFVQHIWRKNVFVGNFPLYESQRTFLIRKNLKPEVKRIINEWVDNILCFGTQQYFNQIFESEFVDLFHKWLQFKNEFKTYRDLNAYVNDYTVTRPLSLNKLQHFFRIYLIINLSILVVCIIHYLILFKAFFISLFFIDNNAKIKILKSILWNF